MCVIVYKPPGVDVDMARLQMCWEHNRNGAGLMFAEGGMLRVAKGFMKWRSFKRYVKRAGIKRLGTLPVVFHFRIATHGSVDPRNCHPFQVNESLAMAHNGVMTNIDIPKDEDVSDSEMFLRRYIEEAFTEITIGALQEGKPINDLFSRFIGGSKLAFMDNSGDVALVNGKAGTWKDEIWYSNMLWKPYVRATTPIKQATTPWRPAAPITPINGNRIQATSLSMSDDEDGDDWYCLDCHAFFALGEAKRTYWTNGMKDRIVDCPECSSPNTVDVEDMFDEDEVNADADTQNMGYELSWKCYDCSKYFERENAQLITVNGEERCTCPFCQSNRTYECSWQDVVDRFGADYFNAESYDLTRGGDNASK